MADGTTAGYSGTPLTRKLGIKPGARVGLIGAPHDFDEVLGELPPDVTVVRLIGSRGETDGPAEWAAGAQAAQVKISCTVSLKVFSALGIPASQTFTDVATAPLDPFSERTG